MTLLTGDRVFVKQGQPTGKLLTGPGRDRMGFSTFRNSGHSYVVPADAAPLVTSGALDLRLFDVTTLLDAGYGDARRGSLPLMVTYTGGTAAPQALTASGAKVTRALPGIGGAAVTAEKASASGFWAGVTSRSGARATLKPGLKKIWLDGVRQASLDRSVPQIGAPTAWQAGYTGTGVKVAVLDTGVDQTHPDLADRQIAEANFSEAPDNVDHFGHGTHVASIIAGTGAKSGGKFRGVAYGASLLDGKVLDDNGFGSDSGIIAGMQWAADQGATVANLSLGGGDTPDIDPLEEAVNRLSAEHGTLFVIAAGNSGPDKGSLGSPGTADAALTVGAVDRDNSIAPFSSRGPRAGDGGIKPDITAPGVGIVAARHSDGTIGPPVVDGYTALSGTSMATPHVSGAAALVAQQHPGFTGQQIKALLTASATPTAGLTPFDQGSGRVDSAKALTQAVTSEPTSLGFGVQQWPHDDDQPVTKAVSYSNAGTTPVELDLAIEATAPGGKSAAAGVLSVTPAKLVVPAGGKAEAKVTGDTKASDADGVYSGTLVATTKGSSVRTPVAIEREVESYDVTLDTIDRTGAATPNGFTLLINAETGDGQVANSTDGHAKLRVPKGRYVVSSTVQTGTGPDVTFDLIDHPSLDVSGDVAVELDARRTKPVKITVPSKTAALSILDVSVKHGSGDRPVITGFALLGGGSPTDILGTTQLGPEQPPSELVTQFNSQWYSQTPAEYYGLAWYVYGSTPTGFTKDVRPADLAKVNASFGPGPAELQAYAGASPTPLGQPGFGWGSLNRVNLPGERTEYFTGGTAQWSRVLLMVKPPFDIDSSLDGSPKTYQAGRTYTETSNRPVFGPVLPHTPYPGGWVYRDKNTITASTPLFGDGSGNYGQSLVDNAYTRLYRDGKLVGETPYAGGGRFDVAPGRAAYRLSTEANRSNRDLSTRVSANWTFTSDTTASVSQLPISVIRYFPALDANGTAPAGVPFTVPVAVQDQGNDNVKVPYKLTADASYDGGQTWSPATIVANTQLVLRHPWGAGTVSLRAKATDGNGNTVEQTILNAYRLQ